MFLNIFFRYVDLPRWQVTYELYDLLPGQSYFVKVLCKNAVGWSPYSEYNTISESETASAAPVIFICTYKMQL